MLGNGRGRKEQARRGWKVGSLLCSAAKSISVCVCVLLGSLFFFLSPLNESNAGLMESGPTESWPPKTWRPS